MRNLVLDKILLTRFDTTAYQQLATVAEQQQLSKAALVRLAVTEYITEAKGPLAA